MNIPSGVVDLPLHGGKCPQWLFPLMKKLAGQISEIIIDEYGEDELLKRLSDPLWFQAFGCVLGFDWHSSGLTTTTTGALKEAFKFSNLPIAIAGGKGKTSRKTPEEIINKADELNLNNQQINNLIRTSRLSAKVDNSLIQDGFQLYHHVFFFTKNNWTIVQQGMNNQYARRYHWIKTNNFTNEPHTGIISDKLTKPLNLTAKESEETRKCSLDLIKENPIRLKKYLNVKTINKIPNSQTSLLDFSNNINNINKNQEVIELPKQHFPKINADLNTLIKVYETQPSNYEDMILVKGMGQKNIRALAMVSHLVHGTELSWKDPVKFSFAHGGKDSWPYPVDTKKYNENIDFLKNAINDSKIGNKDRLRVLNRLNRFYSS